LVPVFRGFSGVASWRSATTCQVDLPVLHDLDLGPLRQRVDALDADAVEAAGDLVHVVVELAAGVQLGHDHLDGGTAVDVGILVLHRVDGHAAAVVEHGARAIDAELDRHRRGEAGHRLVDRVVHALVDEVVQRVGAGAANVHAGTLADRLQPLEDLDRLGRVVVAAACGVGSGIGHGGSPVGEDASEGRADPPSPKRGRHGL
jgi:hypothetical protein